MKKTIKNLTAGILFVIDVIIVWVMMAFILDSFLLTLIQALIPIIIIIIIRMKVKPWTVIVSLAALLFSVISLFVHGTVNYRFCLLVSIFSHILLFNNLVLEERLYYRLQLFLFLLFSLLVFCYYPESIVNDVPYYRSIFQVVRINPNIYGVYVVLAVIEGVGFFALTKKSPLIKNLLSYLIIAIGFALILYSRSRTCLLSIFVYTLFFSVKKFRFFQNRTFLLVLSKLALLCSLLITVTYILLAQILPENLIIIGKGLFSGREEIWLNAYREFKSTWLFGFAHQIEWGNNVSHMHNGMIEIWCYFGIVPMLAVLILHVHNLGDQNFNINLPVFLGVIAITINIAFENIFISSYFNMIPLLLLLFRTKKTANQSDSEELKERQDEKDYGVYTNLQ